MAANDGRKVVEHMVCELTFPAKEGVERSLFAFPVHDVSHLPGGTAEAQRRLVAYQAWQATAGHLAKGWRPDRATFRYLPADRPDDYREGDWWGLYVEQALSGLASLREALGEEPEFSAWALADVLERAKKVRAVAGSGAIADLCIDAEDLVAEVSRLTGVAPSKGEVPAGGRATASSKVVRGECSKCGAWHAGDCWPKEGQQP